MMISEWFNPRNIDHIKAYGHLMRSGTWPENFLPEGITFDSHWQFIIRSDIADIYVDNMLAKQKDATS